MKRSSVVKVSEDGPPEIIGEDAVCLRAQPGEPLVLQCEAFTNGEDFVTLIYWLVNGSFPEDISSSGRIVELEESTLEEGAIIQRSLLLKTVTSEDLKSTFTCVVTNSIGMAQKHIKLAAKHCGSDVGKKQKH